MFTVVSSSSFSVVHGRIRVYQGHRKMCRNFYIFTSFCLKWCIRTKSAMSLYTKSMQRQEEQKIWSRDTLISAESLVPSLTSVYDRGPADISGLSSLARVYRNDPEAKLTQVVPRENPIPNTKINPYAVWTDLNPNGYGRSSPLLDIGLTVYYYHKKKIKRPTLTLTTTNAPNEWRPPDVLPLLLNINLLKKTRGWFIWEPSKSLMSDRSAG